MSVPPLRFRQPRESRRRPGLTRGAQIRFIRPPFLPGVEIIRASARRSPTALYSGRYAVILCERGESSRQLDSGPDRGVCPPILLEPGQVHPGTRACVCAGVGGLFIEPTLLLQFAAAQGLTHRARFRIAEPGSAPLVAAVADLWVAVDKDVPASEQQVRFASCLKAMLDFMVEPAQHEDATHPAVMTARDYLRRRAHESITLDELSRISRMSRFHLVRAFAAHIGLPPHAYQTRLRIESAMSLLRAGVRPGEVANLTGFADQSHLTRHFRRVLGITPGQYAKGK